MCSWFNTCAVFKFFSWQHYSEWSFRVASRLYCVVGWDCNQPWGSDGGSGVCAGFCAPPSVHTEKLFLWDWDQNAEHCCHCSRCCSEQCLVSPLGSTWCRGWPSNCRFEVVPWENCITKEGGEGYTGALVWCRNCCIISCWWDCTLNDCPHLWYCWARNCAICWGAWEGWSPLLQLIYVKSREEASASEP